jgi:hypothetical protein
MPANANWGRTGWGRTPSSLRRQAPPSFMHRHEDKADIATYGEIRFLSDNIDSDLASRREGEAWVEALTERDEGE